MVISVIVSLLESSLEPRQLLNSLKAQENVDLEVLVFYPQGLILPEDLPEEWICTEVEEHTTTPDVWNLGMSQALGLWVCFTDSENVYHPKHFKLLLEISLEKNSEGIFSQGHQMGLNLLPLESPSLPSIINWGSYILKQNLPYPMGAFLFSKTALDDIPFSQGFDHYYKEIFLFSWTQKFRLETLELATFQYINKELVKNAAQKQEFRQLSQNILHSLADKIDNEMTCHIIQAFHQRESSHLISEFQSEYLSKRKQAKVVLWLTSERSLLPESYPSLWGELSKSSDYQVVVLNIKKVQKSSPKKDYTYSNGVFYIDVEGLHVQSTDINLFTLSEPILKEVQSCIDKFQPQLIHMTSFEDYSLNLASLFVELNIPIFYSVLNTELLKYKESLLDSKTPIEETEVQANNKIHDILNHCFSGVFLTSPDQKELIQYLRLSKDQCFSFTEANVLKAYSLPTVRRKSIQPNLDTTYIKPEIFPYLNEFAGKNRVLDFQVYQGDFLTACQKEGISAIGIDTSFSTIQALRNKGFVVHSNGQSELKKYLCMFDGIHAAYPFESLSHFQLLDLLRTFQQSLQKQGQLLLRFLSPPKTKSSKFLYSQGHIRPYSTSLIQVVLEYFGFQVDHQGTIEEESEEPDHFISAKLIFNDYPPVNAPLSTPDFKAFWDNQMPSFVLPESGNMLIIGPQIVKLWKMNKVFMDQSMGVTLDINELEEAKSTSAHTFRYSSNLIKTLKTLNTDYDVIIIQGTVETLWPKELKELLTYCYKHLKEDGTFYIQTLMPQPDGIIPELFWETLLNVRPYPHLNQLLEEHGFSDIQIEGQICQLFECKKTEVPQISESRSLPALPEYFNPLLEKEPQILSSLNETLSQTEVFILPQLLEKEAPNQLLNLLQKLYENLPLFANLIVESNSDLSSLLNDNRNYRLYPLKILQSLFQKTGFTLSKHWTLENQIIFHLQKNLDFEKPLVKKETLVWAGDMLQNNTEKILSVLEKTYDLTLYPQPSLAQEKTEFSKYYYKGYTQGTHQITHHTSGHLTSPLNPSLYWIIKQNWEQPLPEQWVYEMNLSSDQVWVSSQIQKSAYIESGVVEDKLRVISPCFNVKMYFELDAKYILESRKNFKFLYVGDASYLKGLDTLIKSYFKVFTQNDDVSLVLFLSPIITQTLSFDIEAWISENRTAQSPEVVIINEALSEPELAALYKTCTCFVYPHRLESTGLSIAKAFASHLPIITSESGAALDFCTIENSYLIDVTTSTLELSLKEPMDILEPDTSMLEFMLKQVFENPNEAKKKTKLYKPKAIQRFHITKVSEKITQELKAVQKTPVFRLNRDHILGTKLKNAFYDFENEDYALAAKKFEYVLAINPYQSSVQYNLGTAYLMLQNYEKAVEYLSQSLRDGECTADLCLALSNALKHLGDHETSEEFLNKAKELDSSLFAQI